MNKPLNWFEIPAADLDRARNFYETALGIELRNENFESATIAVFPYDRDQATGGCLILTPEHQPALNGPILYLNAGKTLDEVLGRVAASGGKLLLPRTALPPGMGFYAHIIDSEGNRIGLHGLN
jgi:uncharacterized protein